MAAKDLYEKDFYAILGVDKKAAADEIKKKYRSLARELHPITQTPGHAAECGVRLRGARRGAVHQESRRKNYADLFRGPRPAPRCADGHAPGEPSARPVEHLPLPVAGAARFACDV